MKKFQRALCAFLMAGNALMAQTELTKPQDTEVYEPVPKVVTPAAKAGDPPSDAIVLFDGKNFDNFVQSKDGSDVKWKLNGDGSMTVVGRTGDIKTKQLFGDCQLHIEWRTPIEAETVKGQSKGNSGVFLQERYEVQVLNSYQNTTYTNGQAGSIYKQTPPMANACTKMGEWNVYDIFYKAPTYRKNGSIETFPMVTVVHNGVVVQHATIIQGTTENVGAPKVVKHGKGAIRLQDHLTPVSYRNIWIREL
jgi:Domain of Unknown Function (DUF1080)